MEFDAEKFNHVKRTAEIAYENIVAVHCPYFNEKVLFNSKGLDHLIFKAWNRTRPLQDQFTRFRHLALAPEVVKYSRTLQGVWKTQKFERVKKQKRWQKVLKWTTYYEFIAIMESHGSKVRVKVVVKEIEGAEKFFLSIIPFWGKDRGTGERRMHSGDLESD